VATLLVGPDTANAMRLITLSMAPATHAAPAPSSAGPEPRFVRDEDVFRQVRERYLLFVKCVESKPGDEPKNEYLYPLAAPAKLH
jgi:hypothetical protein